jgi:mannose-1-phosphate guanylyltransferase/mannose-6-phosphate isomerase
LWPLSRSALPKQLLALTGDHTMIQNTVLRAAVPGSVAPILVCGEGHRFLVAEQMQAVGVTPHTIVLESTGRNTAPAAAVASLIVAEDDPDGLVLLLPSDHVIADGDAFRVAVARAADAAHKGHVVTFGLKAERPETGYGYIRRGSEIGDGVFKVARFAEKPDATTADSYVKAGDYFWNSGMFIFRADVFLAELARLEPELLAACRTSLSAAKRDLDFVRLDAKSFDSAKSISIDYAVMEKTDKAAVVPCTLGWSDVGAWSSLWEILKQDKSGNVVQGDVVVHNSHDTFVRSEGKLTALVGVHDLAVIVTKDAVLVADKSSAQDVKVVVDRLKADNRTEHTEHSVVFRPWGSYEGIDAGENYQVKQITVKPGGRLSLQSHTKRAEHWIVVQGTAQVTCDDKVFLLNANESTFIPLGSRHRLENPGTTPLRIIEVQSGSYLGEDDIVRYDDAYGRAGQK